MTFRKIASFGPLRPGCVCGENFDGRPNAEPVGAYATDTSPSRGMIYRSRAPRREIINQSTTVVARRKRRRFVFADPPPTPDTKVYNGDDNDNDLYKQTPAPAAVGPSPVTTGAASAHK